MSKKKKSLKKMAHDKVSPPPPPPWSRPPGAPEPIHPEQGTVNTQPILMLDEETFMAEVANRLNAFIDAYPQESQHILSQFVEYEHELVGIHSETRRIARSQEGKTLEREPPTPGITVAQLFTALLQTHHGNGYVLRPLLARDPNAGLGYIRITKFVVERQENLDIEHPV